MMGEYQKAIDILNRVLVYYPQQKGADPGAVVFDTLKSAVARNIDVVLVDALFD